MGQILKAECECGFTSNDFFAGGGRISFETVCNAPAVCVSCGHFFIANYFSRSIRCPQCKSDAAFYDDPSLRIPTDGNEVVFSWNLPDGRKFILHGTSNYCPDCRKKNMHFTSVGAWD